jgi:hypothetical protein
MLAKGVAEIAYLAAIQTEYALKKQMAEAEHV